MHKDSCDKKYFDVSLIYSVSYTVFTSNPLLSPLYFSSLYFFVVYFPSSLSSHSTLTCLSFSLSSTLHFPCFYSSRAWLMCPLHINTHTPVLTLTRACAHTTTGRSVPPACRRVTDWLLPRRLGFVDVRNRTGTPDHRGHGKDGCLSLPQSPFLSPHYFHNSHFHTLNEPHWSLKHVSFFLPVVNSTVRFRVHSQDICNDRNWGFSRQQACKFSTHFFFFSSK